MGGKEERENCETAVTTDYCKKTFSVSWKRGSDSSAICGLRQKEESK
jgi:hypothetical protein